MVIDSDTMKILKQFTPGKTKKADAFFVEAIKLREILYAVFLCIARDKRIPDRNLDDFNNLLSLYFSHLKIIHSSTGYSEDWNYPPDSFYLISAPILKDAYDLLFYDSSKNGSRRWYSMITCGSNVKALCWYHKH